MEFRFIVVCYDIPETKVRNRLILLLFRAGLSRIQYSVFSGAIPVFRIAMLIDEIKAGFPDSENKIVVMEMCRTCASHITSIHDPVPIQPRSFIVI